MKIQYLGPDDGLPDTGGKIVCIYLDPDEG